MLRILKTEWLKIKKYPAFWWIMGITILSYPGINSIFYYFFKDLTKQKDMGAQIASAVFGNPFAFPEVFRTVAFTSSLFMFIPAILIIMLITNEYTYKTNRQNIIDGWSRSDFMIGKLFDVLIISVIITIIYFCISLIIGFANFDKTVVNPYKEIHFVGFYFLQAFSQLTFAFLLGLIFRKAFLALGVFIFYTFIVETIGVALLRRYVHDIGRFLFLEVSDRITPSPNFMMKIGQERFKLLESQLNAQVWLTIIFTLAFWGICFLIYKKRDL